MMQYLGRQQHLWPWAELVNRGHSPWSIVLRKTSWSWQFGLMQQLSTECLAEVASGFPVMQEWCMFRSHISFFSENAFLCIESCLCITEDFACCSGAFLPALLCKSSAFRAREKCNKRTSGTSCREEGGIAGNSFVRLTLKLWIQRDFHPLLFLSVYQASWRLAWESWMYRYHLIKLHVYSK